MESFAVKMDNLHEEVARQLFFNTVAYFTHQATQCAVRNQKLKHFKNIRKPKKTVLKRQNAEIPRRVKMHRWSINSRICMRQ